VIETEEFLASMLPRLTAADTALHNGDATQRKATWSTQEPVTLFGAAMMTTGWPQIEATFDRLASQFSDCTSFEIEVVAAGVSDDLAYLVAFEHTTASIGGDPPAPYTLRVTTIFRREDGAWKVVHRHADHLPERPAVRDRLAALRGADAEGPSAPGAWTAWLTATPHRMLTSHPVGFSAAQRHASSSVSRVQPRVKDVVARRPLIPPDPCGLAAGG
jgi:ketosteroid isomerase-like protein